MSLSRLNFFFRLTNHKRVVPGLFTTVPNNKNYSVALPNCEVVVESQTSRSEELGIIAFVGHHPKVSAFVKSRYSDFQVHEIDLNGKIVELTDLGPPSEKNIPLNEPFYTHCTFYKEGKGWTEAVRHITRILGIGVSQLECAGYKDKRAKTTQRISIENVDPQSLIAFSKISEKLKFGHFSTSNSPIVIGGLSGNHFRILLRDVKPIITTTTNQLSVTEILERSLKSFGEYGFVNYFGKQRFGNGPVSPHHIGKAVVQLNWKKAFDLILQEKPGDAPNLKKAKAIWFSSSHDRVGMSKLKFFFHLTRYQKLVETFLLRSLVDCYSAVDDSSSIKDEDLVQVFKKIPRLYRSFYYLSFKSFLWNHMATFRVQNLGLHPVVGDVVDVQRTNRVFCDNNDSTNEKSSGDDETWKKQVDSANSNDSHDGKMIVKSSHQTKILTEEDFVNGHCTKFSIHDVLLPIINRLMTPYANPMMQDHFETLLMEHGLNLDCLKHFRDHYDQDDENYQVNYRPLIRKPENVFYKIVPYREGDDLDNLIPSDLDRLSGGSMENVVPDNSKLFESTSSSNSSEEEEKTKICVILEFSLPKSTYATTALREILEESSEWQESHKSISVKSS